MKYILLRLLAAKTEVQDEFCFCFCGTVKLDPLTGMEISAHYRFTRIQRYRGRIVVPTSGIFPPILVNIISTSNLLNCYNFKCDSNF